MDQICDRLYPNAPLENDDLEQSLKKKLNNVISFKSHISNLRG